MSSKKNKRILLIADHASNYIPSSLKNLGLKDNQLNSHIAYDVGVKELCINLSNLLNSNYIIGEYSRLIIDLNRDISDPTLIPEIVDRKIITKNLNLTNYGKKKRISEIYNKYHYKIKTAIKHNNIKALISLHSFNPIFKIESIIPGIETLPPDLTDSKSGVPSPPKHLSDKFSSLLTACLISLSRLFGSFLFSVK